MTTKTLSRESKARPFAFPGSNEFRRWIEQAHFRPANIVGVSGDPDACPLACYLNARWPEQHWIVESQAAVSWYEGTPRPQDRKREVKLPTWAANFVAVIDSSDPRRLGGKPISRVQALSALDLVVGS